METQYKIIPDLQNQNCLTIHPNTAKGKKILTVKKWFLRFGIQALEMKIKTSDRINENEIKLSVDMIESLRIPLSPRYEIRPDDNEILLGPYIGILTASKKVSLEKRVKHLSHYLYDYPSIGGAIAAFSLEGIDSMKNTIEGYVFNPEINEWEHGVYPCPAAVFKTILLSKTWRNYFQTVLGNRMFNSSVFSKLQMYKWLSSLPNLKNHLPETILYKELQDLQSFLELHQQIYIKPLFGSMGHGIFKVSKTGEDLNIAFNEEGIRKEIAFSNVFDLNQFLKNRLKGKEYILQQALDMSSFGGTKVDFRIIMVKNQAGVWKDLAMVARYAQNESVVTNINQGGIAERGEIILEKMFGFSPEEVFQWRKEILHITHEAAQSLELFGVNCGQLGIDVTIDIHGRIWIIEMNNMNPDPIMALYIGDKQTVYQIRRMNMLYAKKLAGFPEEL